MERDYAPPSDIHPLLQGMLTVAHERHVDMSDLVSGLPDGALDWWPSEGTNSLAGLVRHILADERAVVLAAGGATGEWDGTQGAHLDESGTERELIEAIDSCDALVKTVLPGLAATDLAREQPGQSRSFGRALAEEFEHSAMHYGHMQMIRLLWEQAHPGAPRTYRHWGWSA